jgi:hypothetical protein
MTDLIQKRTDCADVDTKSLSQLLDPVSQDNVTIILITGFMAPWFASYPLSSYLRWKGWKNIEFFKYDSICGSIESHGQNLADFVAILAEQRPDHSFYFCCTSMGNLLLRCAFQRPNFPISALRGKHVAVAPPWRGAAWGRLMDRFGIARWITGSGCGKQLRTTALDGFDYMGHHPSTVETLVIAGASSYNPLIPSPNDGTVSLDETILRTPHYRILMPWGIHSLFSFTPSSFWITHRFFLGDTQALEYHPGLNALEKEAKEASDKASTSNPPKD